MPLLNDQLRGLRFAAVSKLLPIYAQLPSSAREMMDTATNEYLEYLTANADRAESLTSRALVHQARATSQPPRLICCRRFSATQRGCQVW